MPSRRVVLLVVLLFLLIVAWRLPAAWVTPAFPKPLVCDAPGGTAWNGRCETLLIGASSLHAVTWALIPGELLHGKLGVRMQVADAALQASGKALVNWQGRVQGYDLIAHLALPNALLPGTPTGWSAQAEVDLPRFESQGTELQAVSGAVRLRQVRQAKPAADFGGFEWRLAEGALRAGQLHGALLDLGGPLRLQGKLAVSLKGEYDLDARVAASPTADQTVADSLQQLGPADAEGFRSMLAAGTF